MGDKELIEKIKSLSFNFRPTASEAREKGFRRVESPDEVYEERSIPDGYTFTNKKGKEVTIVHGDEDRRQVAEIIAEKQSFQEG